MLLVLTAKLVYGLNSSFLPDDYDNDLTLKAAVEQNSSGTPDVFTLMKTNAANVICILEFAVNVVSYI
uniref:Uncharacterized protein n=1 Tax=Panagrolaimus sp. ES5 TaxID=591445 RepID=A0AC34GSY6_9BILA